VIIPDFIKESSLFGHFGISSYSEIRNFTANIRWVRIIVAKPRRFANRNSVLKNVKLNTCIPQFCVKQYLLAALGEKFEENIIQYFHYSGYDLQESSTFERLISLSEHYS
jgi:hypothetical protein